MTSESFAGKSVFITGAGSGIGYETALAFARAGADIIATDVTPDGLEQLRPAVEALGAGCATEILNVAEEQAFQSLVDQYAAQGKLPDIVINNAGIAFLDSFAHTPTEAWRRTLDVNVFGVVFGSRIFINLWQQAGRPGHVVNVGSGASITPMPNMSAYAASKYAVEGLCEVMAMELSGSDIHVTCVHPGVINTAIVRHDERVDIPAEQIARLQRHYQDHGVHPSVVADAIVKGVAAKKGTVLVGPGTTQGPLLKRLLSRRLFRKLMLGEAGKIGYR
jgi:NAD(P)-dependent dehydrogenase (short-subunit alcohol dehydrogenase family)